jgi:hypothetical protein
VRYQQHLCDNLEPTTNACFDTAQFCTCVRALNKILLHHISLLRGTSHGFHIIRYTLSCMTVRLIIDAVLYAVGLRTVLHTSSVGMFTRYIRTKCHMLSCSHSLAISSKQKAKENVHTSVMFLYSYILQIHRFIILSDNQQLSLPVGSHILLN